MGSTLRRIAWQTVVLAALVGCLTAPCWGAGTPGQGQLTIIEPDGGAAQGCPLEHTSVTAEVSGFVSRVSVKQIFHNPREDKIEAVYTFPLPGDAAVNDMIMKVGDRVVRGKIKRREEARRIYEEARDRGNVAALLDQERPNIFTQSVANIMPGEKVEITIQYVELLPYEDGAFKFVFPMVVGPRFIPGQPTGAQGTGWSPDTTEVPDASRITPPVTPKGTRAGHDIDLTVSVNAGVPILDLGSKLHKVKIKRDGDTTAVVSLMNEKEIPNRDFVLEYLVAGDKVQSGVLTHRDGKEGYVTVIMIPPKRVKPDQIAPKEMLFVIDCSGSQNGRPLQKAKETMEYVIANMNPDDTFNIIDFNQGARMLFPKPKKNTEENREKALRYLRSLQARGGTWMGPAIREVCKTPAPKNRLRIVTFMTDGYVGNDFEIIQLVKDLRGKSRWFPFGTGNSVNRFLLDNMARVGGGEAEYVLLNSSGEQVAKKFYQRISTPVLTDIRLETTRITLEDRYPEAISDLWDQKPLVFKAKYLKPGKGTITITGHRGGDAYEQDLKVKLLHREKDNAGIASLWARAKVDALMDQDLMGAQRGRPKKDVKEAIVKVALKHRIMTQYTSFVAVEETTVTVGGKPTKVTVPVEMPDGVTYEGVFGDQPTVAASTPAPVMKRSARARGAYMGAPAPPRRKMAMQSVGKVAEEAAAPRSEPLAGEPAELEQAVADGSATPSDKGRKEELASPGLAKMSPELQALVKRKEEVTDLSDGKIVVQDGKITVTVWLTMASDTVLEKLKEAGLDVSFTATTGKMVIGAIAVTDLEELAKIEAVKLIEPVAAG